MHGIIYETFQKVILSLLAVRYPNATQMQCKQEIYSNHLHPQSNQTHCQTYMTAR